MFCFLNAEFLVNSTGLIDYAPICCALIHKSVFDDIGFFDEKFFVYFDDADFFLDLFSFNVHYALKANSNEEILKQ